MKNTLLDGVLLIPWLKFLLLILYFIQAPTPSVANRFKSRGASLVHHRETSENNAGPQPEAAQTFRTSYYYYDPIATPVNVRQRRQRQFVNADKSSVVVLQTGRESPATVEIKELPPLIRTRQAPPSRFFAQGLYLFQGLFNQCYVMVHNRVAR